MKTNKIKKLSLSKQTVANLKQVDMDQVKGGKQIRSLINDCETDLCWTADLSCPFYCI